MPPTKGIKSHQYCFLIKLKAVVKSIKTWHTTCKFLFMHVSTNVRLDQGLYIGYDSISVLSQSVSLLQVYLLLELSSSSLLAGTGGNRRRPAATSPLVFSVVRLSTVMFRWKIWTGISSKVFKTNYIIIVPAWESNSILNIDRETFLIQLGVWVDYL